MLLHDSRRDARTGAARRAGRARRAGSRAVASRRDRGRGVAGRASAAHATPGPVPAAGRDRRRPRARRRRPPTPTGREIAALYRQLARLQPTAVVELNRAVAVAMADGMDAGLRIIDGIEASGELGVVPPAARGARRPPPPRRPPHRGGSRVPPRARAVRQRRRARVPASGVSPKSAATQAADRLASVPVILAAIPGI